MKLLIDQNLSYRIATILQGDYPGSVATRDVGLARAGDETIWRFAAGGGFTIVSKDGDFGQ